ncbi:MAG: FAD/NAD(P)-binding protein [Candidatus Hydrogenedentes bacterium]|nr:FAD/NAD(P)-binding protein [Candidatus Hydrogenedentota bacterium]
MYAVQAEPMAPRTYRIQRVRRETEDTFTLELAQTDGPAPPRFAPGQFNMLYVYGMGEVPISISGNPYTPETLVHTTRAVGTVTNAMSGLRAGHMMGVRGPFGTCWPVEQAEGMDIVIIAGGIGLAPLRPLIYSIMERREHFGRVVLLYGTRTPEDILFRKELEQWRGRFDAEVLITVDRATGTWRGHVGLVTKLIPRAPFDPYQSVAYVCGPEIMMTYALEALHQRGIAKERMFLSMERNMKCAVGFCGHCQFGPAFICKDGPVFRYDRIERLLSVREI